jgi:hypothetical protein
MSNKETIELTSKGTWSTMKKVKNSDIRHVKVTTGEDTTILDSPMNFNLRIIPRVFTAPLQAVGLVASIFARMTNTKISLGLDNDKN